MKIQLLHHVLWLYSVLIFFVFPEQLSLLAPTECPHLILQALAGPMAAATASTITNPMDVVRARVQVNPLLCHHMDAEQIRSGSHLDSAFLTFTVSSSMILKVISHHHRSLSMGFYSCGDHCVCRAPLPMSVF